MRYFAHSTGDPSTDDWQPLAAHLSAVGELAAVRGAKFGAARAARLAGLLHDLGKYTAPFQRRLTGGPSVDHATAGAVAVLGLGGKGFDVMAELIAYAIAGHHTGLPDRRDGGASLAERMEAERPDLDPCWKQEIAPDPTGLWPVGFAGHPDLARRTFQIAFLGRMIFSCLIDADRLETEEFGARTGGYQVDRLWPALGQVIAPLTAAFDVALAAKRSQAAPTELNALREGILAHVRGLATRPRGIFSLTVPTGGGKTLASLAFALDHARTHGLDRIVYAIPFTSVCIRPRR